jgi:2-polyprenyl-3-methyl-5-hydroxy-6-metoxy-1,4-benzoquinol methylase
MSERDVDLLLQEQLAYYRRRAPGYDDWFFRQGRFDRGPELNARWFAEIDEVVGALEAFRPEGKVLELACGTGIWTDRLVSHAERVVAVDGSVEMLNLNRQRVDQNRVAYIEANLFDWEPRETFDVVFFSFWLSHVPPVRFESFWDLVRSALKPGGRVFFIDSRYDETSTAVDQSLTAPGEVTVKRDLDDGTEWEVVKIFYEPADLSERLAKMGWRVQVRGTPHYFIYGSGAVAI